MNHHVNEKPSKNTDWADADALVSALKDVIAHKKLYPGDNNNMCELGVLERCLTRAKRLEAVLRELAGVEREAA